MDNVIGVLLEFLLYPGIKGIWQHNPSHKTLHTGGVAEYIFLLLLFVVRVERVMPLYLRTFFQNCSVVFAPTEGMGQYLTQECRLDSEKVGILPTGIENRNFQR